MLRKGAATRKRQDNLLSWAVLLAFVNIIIISSLLLNSPNTEQGVHLLTIAQNGNNSIGGIANLFLKTAPGNGKVFIDSFPLTKIDTQISTRSAKRVACDFLKKDCSHLDFFYRINANSSIVGGPSAGAAASLLTIISLAHMQINTDFAMTGTINAGGIIGPVAGIPEKIDGASRAGMKFVFIPLTGRPLCENETICDYDKQLINNLNNLSLSQFTYKNLSVVKVLTINQVLSYLTNKTFTDEKKIISPQNYDVFMKDVSSKLCDRRESLMKEVPYNNTDNRSEKIKSAEQNGNYYPLASFCFSDDIMLREEQFKNMTQSKLEDIYDNVKTEIQNEAIILKNKKIKTISDLETYNIVYDRLSDTNNTLNQINRTKINPSLLAYAFERINSVKVWKTFFNIRSKPYDLDNKYLKTACEEKISETEEIMDYLSLYYPLVMDVMGGSLNKAIASKKESDFTMCFFSASKAKAEADAVSLLLSTTDNGRTLLTNKILEAASGIIQEQIKKGMFPIMGYSYYTYAESLKDSNPSAALTYAEYAVELSKLEMYFPERKNRIMKFLSSAGISSTIFGELLVFLNLIFLFRVIIKRAGK